MQLLATMALLLCPIHVTLDDKAAWQEKLETAIPQGVKLLEAKEYIPFLKAFVEPDYLSKMTEKGTMEEFADEFSKRNGPQLLSVLKHINGRTPTLEDDGKKATYEVNVEGVSKKSITFRKHNKTWHIAN